MEIKFETMDGGFAAEMGLDLDGYNNSLRTIKERADWVLNGGEPRSYTERLAADQNERVKKISSEIGELIREDARADFDEARFVGEAADAVYSLEVMAAARQLPFTSVIGELSAREDAGVLNELYERMSTNRFDLLIGLGSSMAQVVDEECKPDFNRGAFQVAAASLLFGIKVTLERRDLTLASVFNELAERNRQKQTQTEQI